MSRRIFPFPRGPRPVKRGGWVSRPPALPPRFEPPCTRGFRGVSTATPPCSRGIRWRSPVRGCACAASPPPGSTSAAAAGTGSSGVAGCSPAARSRTGSPIVRCVVGCILPALPRCLSRLAGSRAPPWEPGWSGRAGPSPPMTGLPGRKKRPAWRAGACGVAASSLPSNGGWWPGCPIARGRKGRLTLARAPPGTGAGNGRRRRMRRPGIDHRSRWRRGRDSNPRTPQGVN